MLYGHRYTEPDFLFVRSWLPCVFFSGGVTMGNIGRQLAAVSILSLYNLYQPLYYMALYFLSLHLLLISSWTITDPDSCVVLVFFSALDGYSLSSSPPPPPFDHFFSLSLCQFSCHSSSFSRSFSPYPLSFVHFIGLSFCMCVWVCLF